MSRVVKNRAGRPGSRISSKHQVTIPREAFAAAGLHEGDVVRIEATGPGQVILTRQDDLLDQFSGALRGGDGLRGTVEELRDEWA